MRDRSLDEFASDDATGADSDGGTDSDGSVDADREDGEVSTPERDGENSTPERDGEGRDRDGENAATATFEWTPDGAKCGSCGASVTRRWCSTEGAGMVCADCKEW